MRKIVALFAFMANFGVAIPCTLQHSWTLHQILDHFQYYKLIHSHFHTGNLLEHSLWTCRSLAQWFDEDKFWVENLNPVRDLVILGGLLHDVGKAGDHMFFYKHKEPHPTVGLNYIHNKQSFTLLNGTKLHFNNLYKELTLSQEDQQMLAIFIAMHLEFGNISKRLQKEGAIALNGACNTYLAKLRQCCKDVGFNAGNPTLQLLQAAIAVSAADVRAVQPNTYVNSILMSLFGPRIAYGYRTPRHKGINAYKRFDLEGQGHMIRNHLCEMLVQSIES